MKVFIPDSVADEVHEREISDSAVAGITKWKKLVRKAHEVDSAAISLPPLDAMDCDYARSGKVLAMWGDSSGRGHYVGCVIGPGKQAKLIAKFLLSQWK